MEYVFIVRWYHAESGKTGLHKIVSGANFPYLVSAWCRNGWYYYIVDRSHNNQFLGKEKDQLAEYAPCLGESVAYKHIKLDL